MLHDTEMSFLMRKSVSFPEGREKIENRPLEKLKRRKLYVSAEILLFMEGRPYEELLVGMSFP